jgi:hypothetical protein
MSWCCGAFYLFCIAALGRSDVGNCFVSVPMVELALLYEYLAPRVLGSGVGSSLFWYVIAISLIESGDDWLEFHTENCR